MNIEYSKYERRMRIFALIAMKLFAIVLQHMMVVNTYLIAMLDVTNAAPVEKFYRLHHLISTVHPASKQQYINKMLWQ